MIALSIIIPTWNEVERLPRLISLIDRSGVADEVIVADNHSTDGTPELARALGCHVVEGGLPGAGRNHGAAVASGDALLFVDADAAPSLDQLRCVDRLATSTYDAAHFRLTPMTRQPLVRLAYRIADWWFRALQLVRVEHGLVSFLWVRAETFRVVGGFDESLNPGEDVDFIRRVGRIASVLYVREDPVAISSRRFHTENPVWFAAKTAWWEIIRLIGVRRNLLTYRWIAHRRVQDESETEWLKEHGVL